jgi:hypothetical protein
MRHNTKRIIAGAACAVCALVSIFGLGGWKLSGKYADLERTFIYGTETSAATRHSMDAYLDRCSEYSARLAQEAKQYLDDTQAVENVLALSESLSATDGINGRYEVYTQLTSAVEDMYSSLQAAGASNETGVTTAYHDYLSAQNLIKNDGYYMEAADYNASIGAFPANIIAGIFGLDRADTFGR